jgi:hypothetical protein
MMEKIEVVNFTKHMKVANIQENEDKIMKRVATMLIPIRLE